MKFSVIASSVFALGVAVSGVAHAAVSGEMLAQTCAGCHGTFGKIQNNAFMPLAGMRESTFIKAMQEFASNARPNTLMGPLAKSFTADEIERMASYFAAQQP